MIDKSIFVLLKQINISKNAEKVKARIRELWKQNMHKREEILELAGIQKITVERTYKKGTISAKLASAMAQILNINPNYLVGSIDEAGVCTDEILISFLKDEGYSDLFDETKKPKPRRIGRRIIDEGVTETSIKDLRFRYDQDFAGIDVLAALKYGENNPEETQQVKIIKKALNHIETPDGDRNEYLDALTEDDINLLLKGLILRSQHLEDAKIALDFVKALLLG